MLRVHAILLAIALSVVVAAVLELRDVHTTMQALRAATVAALAARQVEGHVEVPFDVLTWEGRPLLAFIDQTEPLQVAAGVCVWRAWAMEFELELSRRPRTDTAPL